MEESTDIPACPMMWASTTTQTNHWNSILPLSSDLQKPQALDFSPCPQEAQNLLLPESLPMPPNPLMPHYLQIPQTLPLPDGLQMSQGSTENQGFQVLIPPLVQLVGPEVYTRPHVPQKTSVRPWRGRTRYSPEHKNKLEKFFLENSKYPSIEQRKELAQSICVTEYQIRIWFKNRRSRYFREHPNEHMATYQKQSGRVETHCLRNEDPSPINAVATHEPMSPSLADVGTLLQIGASGIFLSSLES